MSVDLVNELRALARAKHGDLTIAEEAADLIESIPSPPSEKA